MEYTTLKAKLMESRLLAVIRTKSADDALTRAEEAVQAGVSVLEVTWTTPGADDVIRALQDKPWSVTLGAGTITSAAAAVSAIQAGAEFLVAPDFSATVHAVAQEHGVPYIPGVFTPQDVSHALSARLKLLKLFPAVTGGVVHLTALKEPFPDIDWIPTGGVTWDSVPHWLEAGALAVGMGSALFRTSNVAESVASIQGLGR